MRRVHSASLIAAAVLLTLAILGGCEQPLGTAADAADAASAGGDPAPDAPVDDAPARQELTIDFDGETVGYVGDAYAGAGTAGEPAAGFLDADGWEIIGFSDGDLAFGEEAGAGDYARGTSAGGVSTGGLYAFTVGDGTTALGVQPTATDFAPGSVGIRIPVAVDAPVGVEIAYALWVRNDEDRATRWTCAISADGETFTTVDDLTLITGEAANGDAWTRHDLAALVDLAGVDIAQTGTLHVRWSAVDEAGSGSRDEVAIDDIVVAIESD